MEAQQMAVGCGCLHIALPTNSGKDQGKATHPKNHPPKYKQFAQTVCANSFVCFLLILKGKGDNLYKQTVPKLFGQTVCANCFYLGGWFFGWASGKIKTYTGTSPPLFSKKAMPWGKKWPVQMNLPFFAVKAYVPGGVQNQPEKNSKNAFRPVPVQKFTFPGSSLHEKRPWAPETH